MQHNPPISLVKFILMHPCTLFPHENEYISNIRSHSNTKVAQNDVVYAHCKRCHTPLADSDVFIELLVKFLLRGVYISATDVLFVSTEPESGTQGATCSLRERKTIALHCDLLGHHPATGSLYCVFICTHSEDLTRTWVHARDVVRVLERISPHGACINIVVIPLYIYERTNRLIFSMNPRNAMSRAAKRMRVCGSSNICTR